MEIVLTEKAREKVRFYLGDKKPAEWGLRVVAKTRNDFGFSLVELNNVQPSDQVAENDGLKVVVDEVSSAVLDGARVDFVESAVGAGFKVETKGRPAPSPQPNPADLLADPLAKKVQEILTREINPSIASHGGVARLVDIKDKKVVLQFGGGCHGCGMVDVTLKQGIERRIKELLPEIEEVVDATDHESGTNPYFAH